MHFAQRVHGVQNVIGLIQIYSEEIHGVIHAAGIDGRRHEARIGNVAVGGAGVVENERIALSGRIEAIARRV